ncbi:MAG: GH116 family glycosyl hydrolase [Patescibacteria group bacterium]|nr:GH116 family glycosyl hydrolase [Patescibacteria group bacterium]
MESDSSEKNQLISAPLWAMGLNAIRELETDFGILASGREEIYGCIFGRDSLIAGIKLLKAYHKTKDGYFLSLVKKVLLNLARMQGKAVNIESGEEPGKIIHEFRKDRHEHLTSRPADPWYLYPDNIMRNFDSVDSTPLFLIAVYRYWQASRDEEFLSQIMPNVNSALDWLLRFGDNNSDGFIDYLFHTDRKFGGLRAQSWMDSAESVFHEDGKDTPYPIAPAEVQGYAYLAMRLWAKHFFNIDAGLSAKLTGFADDLKEKFNQKFIIKDNGGLFIASGLDGNCRPMSSARSSMGHLLWAAQTKELDGLQDCILSDEYIPQAIQRLMAPDLFVPQAGIRTLSSNSSHYDPASYHNGSIWPHDTAMAAGGMENFGYWKEAKSIGDSLKSAWEHFGTPIELFVYNQNGFMEYCGPNGQKACAKQAWSAAAILAKF